MEKTPLRLLIVLRLCPLVPFNLLNYYVGATYRFQLQPYPYPYPYAYPYPYPYPRWTPRRP